MPSDAATRKYEFVVAPVERPLEVSTHTAPAVVITFSYSYPPAMTVSGVEIHVTPAGASAPRPDVVPLQARGAYAASARDSSAAAAASV